MTATVRPSTETFPPFAEALPPTAHRISPETAHSQGLSAGFTMTVSRSPGAVRR